MKHMPPPSEKTGVEEIEEMEYARSHKKQAKPFVSVVVPAYNEASLIEQNLTKLCRYLESLEGEYLWELVVVNDGSTDETGSLAESFASTRKQVRVLHHRINFKMGQALRYAFNNCRGDYIVTMDLDLSYAPEHISSLLSTIRKTRAKIVIASPYAKGGRVSQVPFFRLLLSKWANRLLSFSSNGSYLRGRLTTLTGLVRVYDAVFLKNLDISSVNMDVNLEIVQKALLLHARIEEIPAHLDWSPIKRNKAKRTSSLNVVRSIGSCLASSVFFRPGLFFILPGFVFLGISLAHLIWAVILSGRHFVRLASTAALLKYRFFEAVSSAFFQNPFVFLWGGFFFLLAVFFLGFGVLAVQQKHYFRELFHLGTSIHKEKKK
jgi:glycosyltransferase involved in cell wall biosynthesis